MLRSAKSSTSFRNASGSGSNSSLFRSGNNGQASTSAESGMHPNLGLHSAAATGNVGLVKFALDNGQPHTSILNGLLPLHAACSGGSEPVVRLLIDYGADVNATRVKPTKANASGPGTGTEGSTPLHFASANGHLSIVRLLLENGARPTARDRDRQTPLSLASSQGHAACVSILKSWIGSYGPNGLTARAGVGSSSQADLSSLDQKQSSSPLRSQRSFESLSSAAAGVKASLRSHKKQALAKVSSNPNLQSISSSNSYYSPMLPPPLPTSSRAGLDTAVAASATPQTLSSVPNALSKDYKRRPSLPSIFERAANSSSTSQNLLYTQSPQLLQAESIEELNSDAKNSNGKPPISPSRMTHRLNGKRSLTGLLSKASSSTVEEVSPVPSMDSKYVYGSNTQESKNKDLATLPLPFNARARSGSVDVLAKPSNYLTRSELGGTSLASSPTSSMDNYDSSARQNSIASHGYRPRKSSNLSITSSNPSPLIAQSGVQDYNGNLSIDQGRKRSQSTTSVPRYIVPAAEIESFRKLSLSQHVSTSSKQQGESQSDDTKEFLQSSHLTANEKINAPTRYRSHRSPLLSSKLLDDMESRNPSSPSLGLRQLHSQRSTSSLVSSASSSNTNPKQTRGMSFTSVGAEEEDSPARVLLEQGSTTRLHGSPGYPDSTASKTSKSSIKAYGVGLSAQEQAQAILRIAEEKVSPSGDIPAVTLTQMLAAYGEALAQERRGASSSTNSPENLRKQTSLASLTGSSRHFQLPSVTEVPVPSPKNEETLRSVQRTLPGSLTPVTTPSDSPQMVRSQTESSATSFSRSISSQRQRGKVTNDAGATLSPSLNVPQSAGPMLSTSPRSNVNGRHLEAALLMEAAAVIGPSKSNQVKAPSPPLNELLSHRHSPSLPNDLSLFAGSSPMLASMSSTETTPRSKRRIQHRPSNSESHSSLDHSLAKRLDPPSPLSPSKSSAPQTPELQKTPSFNATDNEARTPLSEYDLSPDLASANQSQILDVPNSSRLDKDSSARLTPSSNQAAGGGKRKGAVKAFLTGIKNNVVLR